MNIRDYLNQSAPHLADRDTARLDVEILLCHVLKQPRSYLYIWPERELSTEQVQEFNSKLARRLNGEPIAYILGEKEFWSLSLAVNHSTLIPRPETELLVEIALELLPPESRRILDLGTGTGAIALALAHERPQWRITAVDQSEAAVALAKTNQNKLGLRNVDIKLSDWFSNLEQQRFDLIVSNPPYVEDNDPHLELGDVRFEPRTALVATDNGLADIKIIASQAPRYLNKDTWLVVEHGYRQQNDVQAIFKNNSYNEVETRKDLGNQPRVTMGRYGVD